MAVRTPTKPKKYRRYLRSGRRWWDAPDSEENDHGAPGDSSPGVDEVAIGDAVSWDQLSGVMDPEDLEEMLILEAGHRRSLRDTDDLDHLATIARRRG